MTSPRSVVPLQIAPAAWDTTEFRSLIETARATLLDLLPGMTSYLTNVEVTADDQMAPGANAKFRVTVRNLDGVLAPPSLVSGRLLLKESAARTLTDQHASRIPPSEAASVGHRVDAQRSALTVLHELLHSTSFLTESDYVVDFARSTQSASAHRVLEATTDWATKQLFRRWVNAAGLELPQASLLDPAMGSEVALVSGDNANDMRLTVVGYPMTCAYLDRLAATITGESVVLRDALLHDLVGREQFTIDQRLADALLTRGGHPVSPRAAAQTQARSLIQHGFAVAADIGETLPDTAMAFFGAIQVAGFAQVQDAARRSGAPGDIRSMLSLGIRGECAKRGAAIAAATLDGVAAITAKARIAGHAYDEIG